MLTGCRDIGDSSCVPRGCCVGDVASHCDLVMHMTSCTFMIGSYPLGPDLSVGLALAGEVTRAVAGGLLMDQLVSGIHHAHSHSYQGREQHHPHCPQLVEGQWQSRSGLYH
jgi:hypothetical protein